MHLTPEQLKEIFEYDPERNVLLHKKRERKWFESDAAFARWNGRYPGTEAARRQRVVSIQRRRYSVNRIIAAVA